MKLKDMQLVVVVIVVSLIASYIIANKVISPPKNQQQVVKTVSSISSSFPVPNTTYFNNGYFDPTQLIQINNQQNTNPFGSATTP